MLIKYVGIYSFFLIVLNYFIKVKVSMFECLLLTPHSTLYAQSRHNYVIDLAKIWNKIEKKSKIAFNLDYISANFCSGKINRTKIED